MGSNTGFEGQNLVIVVLVLIGDMTPYNVCVGRDIGDGDKLDTLVELDFLLFIRAYHWSLRKTLSIVRH